MSLDVCSGRVADVMFECSTREKKMSEVGCYGCGQMSLPMKFQRRTLGDSEIDLFRSNQNFHFLIRWQRDVGQLSRCEGDEATSVECANRRNNV
jgi:hypothetical protein